MILKKKDIWPFSHYPMYSSPSIHASLEGHQLYAVDRSGKEILFQTLETLFPLGPHCLSRRIAEKGDRFQGILNYYSRRCRAKPELCGLRNGSELERVRLYSVSKIYNAAEHRIEFGSKVLLQESAP